MTIQASNPRSALASILEMEMAAPRCVEHDFEMALTRTEVAAYPDKVPVDFYSCDVTGCAIKFAQKLGGYGSWIDDKFILLQEDRKPAA